jgi:hypothetical protein
VKPLMHDFAWMLDLGVARDDLNQLSPCVPGEFTTPDALYVNTATPRSVYRGTHEGTLPLVPGRWYMLPTSLANRYPALSRETLSVAAAVSRSR